METMSEKRLLDFYAQEPHFIDHFAPVWIALDPDERGHFFVPHRLLDHAKKRGIEPTLWAGKFSEGIAVLCINSSGALRHFTHEKPEHKIAFFEHGAGFTFGSFQPSYAGSPFDRRYVDLFVNPNKYSQRANIKTFPKTMQAIVGCPKMDKWHNQPTKPRDDDPLVCVSFHWDCTAAMETKGLFSWFYKELPALAMRHRLIGHAHPRTWVRLEKEYREMGIEPVQDFEEVLARADLYVNDCSSTMYEFASTGRPVVVLNSPTYRRRRNMGLRFWEHSDVGVNCDKPADLLAAVDKALDDTPEQKAKRDAATADVYPHRGEAAKATVEALRRLRDG
jgi:hypothetical protein